MPESIEQKLKRLESEYDEAKQTLSRAEGTLASDMKRLRDEHGFKVVKEAEEAHAELVEEIVELEQELKKELASLDQALNGEPEEVEEVEE